MNYIARVIELLFGCHHSNLSRVFTIGGRSYRVCCDCACRFDYSLETMAIKPRNSSPMLALWGARLGAHNHDQYSR